MNIDSDKLSIILDGLEDAVNSHPSDKFRQGGHRVLSHIRDEIKSGELAPKRVYARAPEDTPTYLTADKEYEVKYETSDGQFYIADDDGDDLLCEWRNCVYINGANWERVEK